MSQKIAIHQFNSGITARDGIGNAIFFIQELLRNLGFRSEVFVEHFGPGLEGKVHLVKNFRPQPNDILLIHHSIIYHDLKLIEGFQCRKMLVYHSITPPDLFDHNDRMFAETATGYGQISWLGSLVEASIAMSPYNARQLRSRGLKNVAVIPLLKDFGTIRDAPHRKLPYYDESAVYRLLHVGRITPHKCQHELIEAVGALRSVRDLPLQLVLIGHSDHGREYRNGIDRRIRELDLADQVIMPGSVPDDELLGHYRAANAFVSFSLHEGFGIPLIEAMALDLPVVAYGAAAVPDTLGQAGILLEDKSADCLKTHLLRLHEDGRFRAELIRKQRERVLWYDRSRIESALQQWLVAIDAYGGSTVSASSGATPTKAPGRVDFEAEQATTATSSPLTHYVIEGPFETSYSLAYNNRQMALALDGLENAKAYIEPAEGVEYYSVDSEAASRLPEAVTRLVRPTPLTAERIVTIRHMHPPRPNGMIGDVRLVHLPWEESAIPADLADLINEHLDGAIVASEFVKRVVRNSGVRLPISVVGHGLSPRATETPRPTPSATSPFIFLHISSGLPRKGIEELIQAYCIAFSNSDPVLLVIKTASHDQNVVAEVMRQCGSGSFAPAIQVITEDLGDSQMEALYGLAHAMVLPSRGEGFCYPAAEAMARRVPVIITGHSGQLDFCSEDDAALIDYDFELSKSHLGVSNSMWVRASTPHLVSLMRKAYEGDESDKAVSAKRVARAFEKVQSLQWTRVAERIDRFVNHLVERHVMTRRIRIAWISTYNSQCGIATNSQNLLKHFDPNCFEIEILANDETPLGPDPSNLHRLWTNREGHLDKVEKHVLDGGFDAVYIQFHFAFYDLDRLEHLLLKLKERGIDTYMALHRTKDHELYGASLRQIADTLKTCTRLFVHGVDDVNRLKSIGIVDNVVLLPPGVIEPPALNRETTRSLLGLQRFSPVIGAFGFLVPPKGFQAIIQAFALFRRHYPEALLLMLTAEIQSSDSSGERERCHALINALGLQNNVRLITEFIDDEEEITFLLSGCDAVVFGYQYSMEAASGAIRIGLASGRPVGCTPLPIFDDFTGLVHQFRGISPADIAEGMRVLVDGDYPREELARKQRAWLTGNSWAAEAKRIANIVRGCLEERLGEEIRFPAGVDLHAKSIDHHATNASGTRAALQEMIESELGALNNRQFIDLTFRRVFGRAPTNEELGRYEGTDLTNSAGRWRAFKEISESAELNGVVGSFRSETFDASVLLEGDDAKFLNSTFRLLLLRDPDLPEKERHLRALASGAMSRRQVVDCVIGSSEFRDLSRPLRLKWPDDPSEASRSDQGGLSALAAAGTRG